MINWNPFKNNKQPKQTNVGGVQIIGPGSNNVKVINLPSKSGTQIIIGSNPQYNQTYQTSIPIYGQNNNFGFIPVRPTYQQTVNYQVPLSQQYQNNYQVPIYQPTKTQTNQYSSNLNIEKSNIYPDLRQNTNPYGQFTSESNKQNQNFNLYAKESVKQNNVSNSGNPYY